MRQKRRARRVQKISRGLPYDRRGMLLFYGGILLGLLGFIFLALGDTVISPILLVLGYAVLIPWGLYTKKRTSKEKGEGQSKATPSSETQ